VTLNNLGATLLWQRKLTEAAHIIGEAVDLYRRHADWLLQGLCSSFDCLGKALAEQGNLIEAEAIQSELLAILRRRSPDDPNMAAALPELAVTLIAQKKFTEAESMARECLEFRQKHWPDLWSAFSARVLLGETLLGQKKYADAEPLLLSGYEGMGQRKDVFNSRSRVFRFHRQPRLKKALELLVQLYEETNRPDQAAEWKLKLAEFEKTATETK